MLSKEGKRILVITIILTIIGLYEVYSSSKIWALYSKGDSLYYFNRQLVFMILGYVALFIFSRINLDAIYKYNKLLLGFSFLLLILVLIPGISIVKNGSRSWLGVGSASFQPSEISKFALILFTSKYLSDKYKESDKFFKSTFVVLLMAGLTFLFIMFQPDFGSGIVILLTILIMSFTSRSKISHYIYLGLIGVLGLALLILAEPYRLERITSYIDPFTDPLGSGFQIIQSIYSLSPGGLLGEGFDGSIQKHFYLPEPQTDFIFAILCEEWGFIGGVIVLILFLSFILTGLKCSKESKDLKKSYLGIGIVGVISIQVIINLSVVVGLIPVTGITLPFISYGGTSLIVTLALTGLLINISRKENKNESNTSSRR